MIDLPKPEVYQDTDTNFTKFWNIRNVLCDTARIVISDVLDYANKYIDDILKGGK